MKRGNCPSGKRRWHDHEEATEQINRLAGRAERQGKPYQPGRAYECNLCAGWHVTAQPLQRASMERGTPLKRTRMTRRPTYPTRRGGKPIRQRSAKRQQVMAAERVPFVLDVLARRPWCEAKLPWVCTGRSTDVNELMRGIWRTDCWLDDDLVTSVCGGCHGFITDHPHWAKHHGQQVEQCVDLPGAFEVAEELRRLCDCLRDCSTDHRLVGV